MNINKSFTFRSFAVILLGTLAVVTLLVPAPTGRAIPAFSRKYETSCTTCHNNYPELNDFGLVFKKNGFKFPKDDETFVKQEPVLLGSKAQKEAFPEAVYPGEIPATIPISFRYTGNLVYNGAQPGAVIANGGYVSRTDLFVPNTFTIISAGSFGPNFSFWIDDDISAAGTDAGGGLGDGWLKYNDLGHVCHLPLNSLNVRFGQFELDLPFTNARTPYLSGYDIFGQIALAQGLPCGAGVTVCGTTNNPFFLGTPQRGIEFGGYPNNGNPPTFVVVSKQMVPQTTLKNTARFDPEKSSIYKRAAQSFDLFVAPKMKDVLDRIPSDLPVDYYDFSVVNTLNSTSSGKERSEAIGFLLPRNLARKFTKSDITNQELLDKGQVLVNGVRIALNLQAAE